MDKNREVKIISVLALLVAVVGLSVAYAALSATLEITGSATINSASWAIGFAGGVKDTTGSGTFIGEPLVSSTSIQNLNISLKNPGDSVSYTFEIANTGSLDATLGTINIGTLSCTGGTGDEAATVCGDLTYTFTYADGTEIKVGDPLPHDTSRQAKITLTYNANASFVPVSVIDVSGLDATLIYNQT